MRQFHYNRAFIVLFNIPDLKMAFQWKIVTLYIVILLYWEHVAKWIGRWTQDQKVWGSIPSAGNV